MNNLNNIQDALTSELFNQCRGIMGTTDIGQDDALRRTLLHFASAILQSERPVNAQDKYRGMECEYLDVHTKEWIRAKFISLSFGGSEPLVQADGYTPVFGVWNGVRGLPKDEIISHYSAIAQSKSAEGGVK